MKKQDLKSLYLEVSNGHYVCCHVIVGRSHVTRGECGITCDQGEGHSCFAANWKEELLQYISPDQLPQAYGGTRCEPDPMCTNFVS